MAAATCHDCMVTRQTAHNSLFQKAPTSRRPRQNGTPTLNSTHDHRRPPTTTSVRHRTQDTHAADGQPRTDFLQGGFGCASSSGCGHGWSSLSASSADGRKFTVERAGICLSRRTVNADRCRQTVLLPPDGPEGYSRPSTTTSAKAKDDVTGFKPGLLGRDLRHNRDSTRHCLASPISVGLRLGDILNSDSANRGAFRQNSLQLVDTRVQHWTPSRNQYRWTRHWGQEPLFTPRIPSNAQGEAELLSVKTSLRYALTRLRLIARGSRDR